jgi:hypothetical protein
MNLAGIIVIVLSVAFLAALIAYIRYDYTHYIRPIELSEYQRRGGC